MLKFGPTTRSATTRIRGPPPRAAPDVVRINCMWLLDNSNLEKMTVPTFMTSPSGQLFNVFSIGGAKALDSGFLLLGVGTGAEPPISDYVPCPPVVAIAWRDALAGALEALSHRPNRPLKRIDWGALAAFVDPAWAKANGWSEADDSGSGAPAIPTAPPAVSPVPLRRTNSGPKSED